VTEDAWLACANPEPMLAFLRGRASDRKFRLFACACCRRWWDAMPRVGREGVELAEAKCGGVALDGAIEQSKMALDVEIRRLNRNGHPVDDADPTVTLLWAVRMTLGPLLPHDVRAFLSTAQSVAMTLNWWLRINRPDDPRNPNPPPYPSPEAAHEGESAIPAALLAEVVGNPFHPVATDPAWLTPTVLALAQGIYADRAFDRLPILADALQDAGCDNEDILNHCRAEHPHVRGCWAVDLLLAKR
jgi:hypothetical protein